MAATSRKHAAPVAENLPIVAKLLGNPKGFSFVQAVRLLALCGRENSPNAAANSDLTHAANSDLTHAASCDSSFLHRGLKVVPELSLGHPTTDIVDIRQTFPAGKEGEPPPPPHYTIVATFLSLYGTSSPLPTFYTEELLDEARQDENASREFLDIFNQTLYRIYYRAYNKYKLGFRTREQHDAALVHLQFCLLGMGGDNLRRTAGTTQDDLRFIGQFSRHARSAQGLKHYLRLRLRHPAVHIEQCVERHMPIPDDQLCRLGRATLNGETAIGTRVRDHSGLFRIHLNELDAPAALRFAPGGEGRLTLESSVQKYLNVPLGYDLVRHVRPSTLPGTRLGTQFGAGGRLGINAFVTRPEENPAKAYVSYQHTA